MAFMLCVLKRKNSAGVDVLNSMEMASSLQCRSEAMALSVATSADDQLFHHPVCFPLEYTKTDLCKASFTFLQASNPGSPFPYVGNKCLRGAESLRVKVEGANLWPVFPIFLLNRWEPVLSGRSGDVLMSSGMG